MRSYCKGNQTLYAGFSLLQLRCSSSNLIKKSVSGRHHQWRNIESQEPPSSLQLMFKNSPVTPVFTGSRIECMGNTCLQIVIANLDDQAPSCSLQNSQIKLELVAVEGDFPCGRDQEDWTSEEFQSGIVKERAGKRPLLLGGVNPILRDGVARVSDLSFTDNSSWTKSGGFRIGARVAPGSGYCGPRIREAITHAFKVKEHRGECKLTSFFFSSFFFFL